MDFSIVRILLLSCLLSSTISIDLHRSHFGRLRDGNCKSCRERLKTSVAEVLPRLSLIKQRILTALGKQGGVPVSGELIKSSNFSLPVKKTQTTKSGLRTSGLREIVIVSRQTEHTENDTTIRFHIQKKSIDSGSEAAAASLLLFLDRKRRIRKGGRGKKVFIEISSRDGHDGNVWNVIASFRTRVKRRRWKSISLPLSIAQNLLLPNQNEIDLKVGCQGCGRLVELVLDKRKGRNKKNSVSKITDDRNQRTKRRKKTISRRPRKRANPRLIISTRYKLKQ